MKRLLMISAIRATCEQAGILFLWGLEDLSDTGLKIALATCRRWIAGEVLRIRRV